MRLAYLLALCIAVAASPAAAAHHHHTSAQQHTNPLKGSAAKLAGDNRRADQAHLPRLTELMLKMKKQSRELIRIPQSRALRIDRRLPETYRYCRPETVTFLLNFSSAHRSKFHKPLTATSCVRSTERQEALKRSNANAARGERHDRLSLHLTGAAVDVTKVGMSREEVRWTRTFLLQEQKRGRIDVTEEQYQGCFHIVVIPVPADQPRPKPA